MEVVVGGSGDWWWMVVVGGSGGFETVGDSFVIVRQKSKKINNRVNKQQDMNK